MINYFNIYKFSFPFIQEQYEEVLFDSIYNDLEHLLTYQELFEKTTVTENNNIKNIILYFKDGKIELLFNKNNDYYIPKFQLSLSFQSKSNNHIITGIIAIFESLGFKDYIFDYDIYHKNFLNKYNIIDTKYLENNFKSFNEEKLSHFLYNIDKEYLKEKLRDDHIIYFSFIYMIYRSFTFYKNIIDSQNIQNSMKDLIHSDLNTQYLGTIELSQTRLGHLDNINIATFKKYKIMLNRLFQILQ